MYWTSTDDLSQLHLGVRWDFETWSALKLEVFKSRFDGTVGTPDRDELGLDMQWSFAF